MSYLNNLNFGNFLYNFDVNQFFTSTKPIVYTCLGGLSCFGIYKSLIEQKIKPKNKVCSHRELNTRPSDGMALSKNVQIGRTESAIIIAPTGTGKSRRILGQNINYLSYTNSKCNTDCSLVVNNPNGELRRITKTDKKIYIFNPFDDKSVGFDPLKNCKTEFDVEKLANIIIESGMSEQSSTSNQKEWLDMCLPLLTSYMLMNWYTKKYSFYEMITNIMTKNLLPYKDNNDNIISDSIANDIKESNVESALVKFKAFMKCYDARGTLSSIYSVMNTCLRIFTNTNVKNVLNKKNFDIRTLRNEKAILYIEIPERHSKYFKALTNILLNQILDVLFEYNGKQVYFLIDEFGTNCKIDNIANTISLIRKFNISFLITCQSINQIKETYKEASEVILDVFRIICVTGGLREEAKYISDIIGTHSYRDETSKALITEQLMPPDKIRRLEDDKILIINGNNRVVVDEMMAILEG